MKSSATTVVNPVTRTPSEREREYSGIKFTSTTNYASSIHHSFYLSVDIFFNEASKCITALVDSGAAVNLIHADLVKELKIPTVPCIPAINITTLNNGPIGTGITHQTVPVTLQIELYHTEVISLFVIDSLKNVIILCHPWLAVHDLSISWNQGELINGQITVKQMPLHVTVSMPCLTTGIESPEVSKEIKIPSEYQ